VNLIFGEVAQHQSQCSIFANQRLSNIFFCFVVFGLSADRLRSVAYQRSSTLLQIAFTEQSFQPFPDGGGWKIEVADDWQRPMWGGSSSRGTGEPCLAVETPVNCPLSSHLASVSGSRGL